MGENKLRKLLFSLLTIGFFLLIPSLTSHAAQFNNAHDMINAGIGEQKLYDGNDGYLYFWQAGITKTPGYEYYTIIGMEVEATYGGVTYTGVLGSSRFGRVDTQSGNYTYSLFKVSQGTVANALWENGTPMDKLLFIYSKSYDMEINCLITTVNSAGNVTGAVHDYYGTYRWGNVYTDTYAKYQTGFKTAVGSMLPWMEDIRTEISKLWNVRLRVTRIAPTPITATPNISKNSDTSVSIKAHYDQGNVRWVNTRDNFSIINRITTAGTGTDYISEYDGADGGILYLKRFEGSNYNTIFSESIFNFGRTASSLKLNVADNFTMGTGTTITRTGSKPMVLNAMISVKANATSDGSFYLLDAQGYFYRNGIYAYNSDQRAMDGSSIQILKVDGNPPSTTNGANDLTLSVNNESLTVTVKNIRDTKANVASILGSGLNTSTVYASIKHSNGTVKNVTIPYSGSSGSAVVNLSTLFGANYEGVYNVAFYATDNVGNQGNLGSKVITAVLPNPVTSSVDIDGNSVNYTDSVKKIRWVKPNDNFFINVIGYKGGTYPVGIQLRLAKSFNESELGSMYLSHSMYRNTTSSPTAVWKNSYGSDTYITRAGTQTDENNNYIYSTSGSNYVVTGKHLLKATSTAHGMLFYPWGITDYVNGAGTYYYSDWKAENNLYKLGVDGVGPVITTTSYGRLSETIDITDAHSGVALWKVEAINSSGIVIGVKNGTGAASTGITVNLTNATSYKVTTTDNVGNETIKTFYRGKLKANVTAKELTLNGKRTLGFFFDGDATDVVSNLKPVLGKYEVTGPNEESFKEQNLPFAGKSLYVQDIYNTTSSPPLSFDTDNFTYATLKFSRINDISYTYRGKISTKMFGESSFVEEKFLDYTFSSGEDSYKLLVDKQYEYDGSTVKTPYNKEYNIKKTQSTNVDVTWIPSGRYRARITMYDYNGNPSGTKEIFFIYEGAYELEPKDLEITEVKDVAWIKEPYPFVYSDSTFPVGLNTLNRLGMSIKQGYSINYRIVTPRKNPSLLERVLLEYRFVDVDTNSELELYDADGKSLRSYHDSLGDSPTKFYYQDRDYKYKDGYLYVQHFVPANVQYKKISGGGYYTPRAVTVHLKVNFLTYGQSYDIDVPLYHYYTAETALDDLEGHKQR